MVTFLEVAFSSGLSRSPYRKEQNHKITEKNPMKTCLSSTKFCTVTPKLSWCLIQNNGRIRTCRWVSATSECWSLEGFRCCYCSSAFSCTL